MDERAFKKKYLALVEQEKDRTFLEASFELKDGKYVLRSDLDAAAAKRLNILAKAIVGNRGTVKTVPAVLALLLAAGLAVFVLFFMNPVLERAMETGLESAFGARAEVNGFRLDLGKLRVSIGAIAVADQEEPMRNLFQTGRVELRMNPQALFRGRIYVEEASAAAITLGAPRSASGALPGSEPAPKPESEGPSPLASAAGLVDFENFDAQALLEREKDRLSAPAAYAEATEAYEAAAARWDGRLDESRKTIEGLSDSTKQLLAVNPKDIRSVNEAKSIAEEAKAAVEKAKTASGEAKTLASAVQADAEAAKATLAAARKSVSKDLDYLKSFVDPKSGAARSALEPTIREILDDKLERWIYYGRRGLEAAKAVGASKDDGKTGKPQPASATRGRDVNFAATEYPRFRLGILASNFTAGGTQWMIELKEVSSDPDLVPSPTELAIVAESGGSRTEANGIVDLRSSAADLFSVAATAKSFPVDLGGSLEPVGVGSFDGKADAEANLRGDGDGSIRGDARIDIRNPEAGSPKGIVGRALAESISEVETVKVSVAYEQEASGGQKFTVKTNLDSIVAAAISGAAERYAKKASAELEKALRDYVGKELEGKFVSGQQLDAVLAAAKGDAAAADALRKALDAKRGELENRGKAMAEEAADKAKAAAQKAASDAAKKAGGVAKDAVKKGDIPKIKF